MLILAFDTSGFAGSAALLDGLHVLAGRRLDPERRSAQTLAPALAELLANAGRKASEVRLVATTTGPGSFTGLRVGVTAAKAFAYAVGANVIGLNTLEVIAAQSPKEPLADQAREIDAVLDAQRKELFVGRFRAESSTNGLPMLTRLAPDVIVPVEQWLASLPAGAVVTGSGLERIVDRLPPAAVVVDRAHWEPAATTVGRLAWQAYQGGQRDDLWKLSPAYLRPSAAEEKASRSRPPGGT